MIGWVFRAGLGDEHDGDFRRVDVDMRDEITGPACIEAGAVDPIYQIGGYQGFLSF
jgi:hypothetical protein